MTPQERMLAIDGQLAHVWMVRAFLKHSDESQTDEELAEVHRDLYDFMLALGAALKSGDAETYLKLATKKFSRLRKAAKTFAEIQPEVSSHTNFQMAALSLTLAVAEVGKLMAVD
jgi:cob(I)alamin adenosyltransferase